MVDLIKNEKGGTEKVNKQIIKNKTKSGQKSEDDFARFCYEKGISFISLDENSVEREKFLKNPKGKCPDFFCTKNNLSMFVEVKTHTLLTNMAREKSMRDKYSASKSGSSSITMLSGPFNPVPELKVPFKEYLRDSSDKFKNIKSEHGFPRVLLLSGFHIERFDVHAVFSGKYEGYKKVDDKLVYIGMVKEHNGLFDSTGSNVSAVVYWNAHSKRYEGIENHNSLIKLSSEDFQVFFAG